MSRFRLVQRRANIAAAESEAGELRSAVIAAMNIANDTGNPVLVHGVRIDPRGNIDRQMRLVRDACAERLEAQRREKRRDSIWQYATGGLCALGSVALWEAFKLLF